jgi:hypothetical protein
VRHASETLSQLDWSDWNQATRTLEYEREHCAMMCAQYVLDGDLEYARKWAEQTALWDTRHAFALYLGVETVEDAERRAGRHAELTAASGG